MFEFLKSLLPKKYDVSDLPDGYVFSNVYKFEKETLKAINIQNADEWCKNKLIPKIVKDMLNGKNFPKYYRCPRKYYEPFDKDQVVSLNEFCNNHGLRFYILNINTKIRICPKD